MSATLAERVARMQTEIAALRAGGHDVEVEEKILAVWAKVLDEVRPDATEVRAPEIAAWCEHGTLAADRAYRAGSRESITFRQGWEHDVELLEALRLWRAKANVPVRLARVRAALERLGSALDAAASALAAGTLTDGQRRTLAQHRSGAHQALRLLLGAFILGAFDASADKALQFRMGDDPSEHARANADEMLTADAGRIRAMICWWGSYAAPKATVLAEGALRHEEARKLQRESARLYERRARALLGRGDRDGWTDIFAAITAWVLAGDEAGARDLLYFGEDLAREWSEESVLEELADLAGKINVLALTDRINAPDFGQHDAFMASIRKPGGTASWTS